MLGRPRPSTLRTVLEAHSSGGSSPSPRVGGILLRKIDDPTSGADCGFGVLMDAQREIEGCLKSVKDRTCALAGKIVACDLALQSHFVARRVSLLCAPFLRYRGCHPPLHSQLFCL